MSEMTKAPAPKRGRPKKEKPEPDYIWVRRWGKMMGSTAAYIEQQVQIAISDGAPGSAIYREMTADGRYTGRWMTLTDIKRVDVLQRLKKIEIEA